MIDWAIVSSVAAIATSGAVWLDFRRKTMESRGLSAKEFLELRAVILGVNGQGGLVKKVEGIEEAVDNRKDTIQVLVSKVETLEREVNRLRNDVN